MSTGRAGVDGLLDAYSRQTAKSVAAQSNLWHAEWLLHRVTKLLPHMIADSPHNAVARDTISQEIAEFLAEERHHPGPQNLEAGAGGEPAPASGTTTETT